MDGFWGVNAEKTDPFCLAVVVNDDCIAVNDADYPVLAGESQGVEITDKGEIKYKLPDRQKAKIELGKRIGFYPDPKVGVNVGLDEASAGLVAAALDNLTAQLPRDDFVKR